MSGDLERRWDDAVETAWREFRKRLADRLAAFDEGDLLAMGIDEQAGDPSAGHALLCHAAAIDVGLRLEVATRRSLARPMRLHLAERDLMVQIGLAPPEPEDQDDAQVWFWTELENREADRAAVMLVRALREVHGVMHPVYLHSIGLEEEEPQSAPAPAPHPVDEPIRPRGTEDVRAGVDAAVRDLFEVPPEWDGDGDLPLSTARGTVWVIVSPISPRVLLHATLVEDVADEPRALVEVNLLNQHAIGLTFSLRDARVAVTRELDLTVLVPEQLRTEIERLLDHVDGWAGDLVARVGGRCLDETTSRPAPGKETGAEESRFQTAYSVMRELEKQERGSVSPATMARIFQQDTGLLLKAIRVTDGRLRQWKRRERQYAEAGRESAVRLATAQQKLHRDVRSRMRQALRLLVDAPLRKVPTDQLSLFDEDECDNSR